MSVFVYIACPPQQLSLLRDAIHPLQFRRSTPDSSITPLLGPTRVLYLVAASHHDDSGVLEDRFPFGVPEDDPLQDLRGGLVAKYRRKGWSQTKIDRAIAQRPTPADVPDFGAALERALLESASTAPVPWIVHWYRFGRDHLDRSRFGELVSVRADQFRLNATCVPEGTVVRIDKVGP